MASNHGVRSSNLLPPTIFVMSKELSLQEKYSPQGTCFGCGPANPQGLHVRSFPEGEKVVAEWKAETMHEAFPGIVNGGIIGALLDCHSNWTAAYTLMKTQGLSAPPCTVTAEFSVKLHRPTPSQQVMRLEARAIEVKEDSVITHAELIVNGKVCASCRGTFVAVKPGHPAYHRW
jgi:acyl-coenzyme A thioesterase PaaI-like protein